MSDFERTLELPQGFHFYGAEFSEDELAHGTRPDQLFEWSGAAEWIKDNRVEADGKLDMQATADRIGIPLTFGRAVIDGKEVLSLGITRGLGREAGVVPIEIYVLPDLPESEKLLTFGHEVGHYFLEMVSKLWRHDNHQNPQIESFCEFFGREMVVSHRELESVSPMGKDVIVELMHKYGASHQDIIFQLMLAGKLPTRVVMHSEVGKVDNPVYSGKIDQNVICIECELRIPHAQYQPGDGTPLLDARGHRWNHTTSMNKCTGRRGLEDFIALNKLYGRWSTEDDALAPREILRQREVDEALRTYALENRIPLPDFEENEPY